MPTRIIILEANGSYQGRYVITDLPFDEIKLLKEQGGRTVVEINDRTEFEERIAPFNPVRGA